MAVGKDYFPEMHPVAGFKLGTTASGIKTPGRKDLVIMSLAVILEVRCFKTIPR